MREYLPTRYRISNGFAVDYEGNTSEQIDCMIFDAHYTPKIIPNEESLYIPAEAIHAVFEVKQKISKKTLVDASDKVHSVRKLKRTTSRYIGDGRNREPKPVFHIIGGLLAEKSDYSDNLLTPTFFNNLAQLTGDKHLDFVFSAQDGYVDMINTKSLIGTDKEYQIRNDGNPFVVQGVTGISYGMIRLLEELSWQGTVQAVEWPKYLSNLGNPETVTLK